jgi:pyruvate,orthophosphate dikinase
MQKMIVSRTYTERQKALNELFPFMKKDIRQILEIMEGYPVTIRLLDPPLHEFLPHEEDKMKTLAEKTGIPLSIIQQQIQLLRETNPMLGHRGVRLAITYPEITMMQAKAIFEASAELIKKKKKILPEIMVPVTIDQHELQHQKKIIMEVYQQVCEKYKLKSIPFHFGTMIETPRAALLANELGIPSDFFSFGTNDLTQMTFAFSRDDIGSFLPEYIKQNILAVDPFAHIDIKGVGQFIESAVTKGKKVNRKLEIGVCGEHAGDPESIRFFARSDIDYVSCSPFRVPVARLVAAQGEQ